MGLKFFMNSSQNKDAPPAVVTQEPVAYDPNVVQATVDEGQPNPWFQEPATIAPLWPLGTKVAVHVYVSQSYGYDLFSKAERAANSGLPSVVWGNLTWGDWGYEKVAEYDVQIPKARHIEFA
jgi:hypothetical protein